MGHTAEEVTNIPHIPQQQAHPALYYYLYANAIVSITRVLVGAVSQSSLTFLPITIEYRQTLVRRWRLLWWRFFTSIGIERAVPSDGIVVVDPMRKIVILYQRHAGIKDVCSRDIRLAKVHGCTVQGSFDSGLRGIASSGSALFCACREGRGWRGRRWRCPCGCLDLERGSSTIPRGRAVVGNCV